MRVRPCRRNPATSGGDRSASGWPLGNRHLPPGPPPAERGIHTRYAGTVAPASPAASTAKVFVAYPTTRYRSAFLAQAPAELATASDIPAERTDTVLTRVLSSGWCQRWLASSSAG